VPGEQVASDIELHAVQADITSITFSQPQAPRPADPVAGIVAGDGRGGRDDRQHHDVKVVRRAGVERRGDQRALSGQRDPRALQGDQREHRVIAV